MSSSPTSDRIRASSAPHGVTSRFVNLVSKALEKEGERSAMMADVLTMDEAADYLRVSRTTLERWVHRKQITSVKLGKHRFFRAIDLTNLLEQNAHNQQRRLG